MNLIALETRDLPSTLLTLSSGIVAGLSPFPGYSGPIDLAASGNLIVVAAQTVPHVKVYESTPTGRVEIASFYAYDPAFRGGVNVAAEGEKVATGTDAGAPHVREFTPTGEELQSYFAGDPSSQSGVKVAYSTPGTGVLSVRPEAPFQIYLDGASANVVRGVAAIFEPFDVGVTNEYPSQAQQDRIATVIFGGSSSTPERGEATVGGLFLQHDGISYPARVFSDQLTEDQQILAASHEAAHLVGAVHVGDPTSIMFPELRGGHVFDSLNFAILSQRLR